MNLKHHRYVNIVLLFTITMSLLTGCASNGFTSWNKTVERVSSGVVSIQVDIPISFDGSSNKSTEATGFIVDRERGIILTNRHVVTPGPVTARAILINNEEIDLTPLYIDPVHDFGFYQYDPKQIQHIKPHQFKLNINSAYVGQEIRIIGNDAGQKLAILDGTISRLDRPAPNYGTGNYNDFNTFYIQAATASTGGSSGSPVINIDGEVVALNAGGQARSANAFYLPLNMIDDALTKLQTGQPITRGTLAATFKTTPYAELKRLGLTAELEADLRVTYPHLKGLLVVERLLPSTPFSEHFEIGDILLTLNKRTITNFIELETTLNSNVNTSISIRALRRGQLIEQDVLVTNLNDITPTALLKFDDSIFHNLSYQQARHLNKNANGVYVAHASGGFRKAGLNKGSVITEVNGNKIVSLSDFINQLETVYNGEKLHLRYFRYGAANASNYALVEVNRDWFEQSLCQWQPELGYWPCQPIAEPDEKNEILNETPVTLSTNVTNKIEDALVQVRFTAPYSAQGRTGDITRSGTGIIVDAQLGLVVVDRSVVLTNLGEVTLTFKNRIELKGHIEYQHPLHNLALLSFDPSKLTDIKIASADLAQKPLKRGEKITQIGINRDGILEYRESTVDSRQELWLRPFNVPQFLDANLEVVHLVNPNTYVDGILLNENNEVSALWATFIEGGKGRNQLGYISAGIDSYYIQELINLAQTEKLLFSLEINLTQIAPIHAIKRGLTDDWIDKLIQAENDKIFTISRISASTDSAQYLKKGDILLAIDNIPVNRFQLFEQLSQRPQVSVTVFREGQVLTEMINTLELQPYDIKQVFFWAGMSLHTPHREARLQKGVEKSGIYIASYKYGSPANRYKVYATRRIVAIDGQAIEDSQDFVDIVKHKRHGEAVLLKTIDLNDNIDVITIRLDNHYWPFFELRYVNGQWQKFNHQVSATD